MTAETPAITSPDTGPFSPLAALLVVLVGVFAFCALMVLAAYAPDLKTGQNGQAHALSKSAIGYAGLVEALKLAGEPVVVNRAPLPAGRREGLLVVTPTAVADEDDVAALKFAGPVLIVLPKWLVGPDRNHRGWVRKAVVIDPRWVPKTALMSQGALARRRGVSRPILHALAAPFARPAILAEGPVDRLQSFAAKGWTPILVDETGATLLARDPKRPIFVLSDPDLINTQGLKSLDTLASALTLTRTLRSGDGPVIFDVRLNGLGKERSLLRLLFDPPFLAVTLCLAAAAALAGFQAACRFGPVRRSVRALALGKEALVDNSAALIALAGREHRMGARYAALTQGLAARGVGAPRDLTGEALTAFLDRLGAQRGAADRLGELTTLARIAPDRARLSAVAMRLFHWRLEMTREHR